MSAAGDSYRTARRIALYGVAVSAALACSNIVIGLLTDSTAVVATGFEFAGDVLASSIVLIGIGLGVLTGVLLGQRLVEMYHLFFRFPRLDFLLDTRVLVAAALVALLEPVSIAVDADDPPSSSHALYHAAPPTPAAPPTRRAPAKMPAVRTPRRAGAVALAGADC